MTPAWKIEKIKAIDDEVGELHPLLRDLFRKLPYICNVDYRHGARERGADFVLTKEDPTLNVHDYIGVVVKADPIKQTHEDVRRQIRECNQARTAEGGKKMVRLSEIWVVTSKSISAGAQDSFAEEWANSKIKFIDCDRLVGLIDSHYDEYWRHANALVTGYVSEQRKKIEGHAALHSLQSVQIGHVEVDQQIRRVPLHAKRIRVQHPKPVKLLDELSKRNFIFIEGSMGAGKSELLRNAALSLCDEGVFQSGKLVPCFMTYSELQAGGMKFEDEVGRIRAMLGDDSANIAFFIDGLDETSHDLDQRVEYVCDAASKLHSLSGAKLVVSSREIRDEQLTQKLAKAFDKYTVCPLTFGAIVSFVEKLCRDLSVTDKMRSDLQNSPLMKALPRTPLSAILLGKLFAEKVRELPSTLPELYAKYCELVLGRWDLQKGAGTEKEYETVSRITSQVAAYMLENDLEVMGIVELRQMFDSYLKTRRTGQDLDTLLGIFLSKTELIATDPVHQVMAFRHQSFKEFFAAVLLFQTKGREAPIVSPFRDVTQHTEYFYLGLIKDAPERIAQLAAYPAETDLERCIKATMMGNYMMAAYQTPYEEVSKAVSGAFRDLAKLYDGITLRGEESWLRRFPEFQLIALLSMMLKRSYAYEFFQDALNDAKLSLEFDDELTPEARVVALFFVDAVLAELKDRQAFIRLVEKYEASMPWAMRMGIDFTSQEAKLVNEATKRMERRMARALKGNKPLHSYLLDLEQKPLRDRKELPAPGVR